MTSAWRREGLVWRGGARNLKSVYKYLKGWGRSHRTIGDGHKLKHSWFPLNIRRHFSTSKGD